MVNMGILDNYLEYYEEDMNIQQQMEDAQKVFEQEKIEKDIVAMVADWSDTFDLPMLKELTIPPAQRQSLAIQLIEEELNEFDLAQSVGNLVEIQDSLGDLLWVTIRAMMEYGIDPVKCIRAIYKSNMSKIDYSLEDAATTAEMYAEQGIVVTTKKKGLSNTFVTHRASDNKVLKSHKFVEPKFKQ
jgi:hypothetical protein